MPRIKKPTDVPAQIERMVKGIVRKFHPELIILFGSQARGDAGPDSDIDLLVVMDFEGFRLDMMVELDSGPHRRAHGYPGHDPGELRVAKGYCRHD